MKTLLLTVFTGALTLSAIAPQDDAKKEKALLQGTWKSVGFETRGESREETTDKRLIFTGDDFVITKDGETLYKGKFKIDSSKKPKHLDFEITEAHREEHQNQKVLAIYAVDGDTLKFCSDEPGSAERPTAFSTTADTTSRVFITLKREKK